MTQKKPIAKSAIPAPKKKRPGRVKVASPRSGFPIVHDITGRKHAEEALRALSARQEAILDAVPDILMELNKDKVYTWANPAGLEFFGEGVVGKEAAIYFEGEQHTYDEVKPPFNGNADVIYIENWQRRKDGEKRLLAWRCRVLKYTDGIIVGALSSAHDITARKQAEEALAASEAELRALFASMHDVVLVIDRAGEYLKIAPTNPDLLVKPPEEMLGVTLRDVFPPEQAETFISVVQQVLDTKQTTQIEYDLIIGDRTMRFETSISPMTEDSTLWVARDITERKQAEKDLRESEERYRQLVERTPTGVLVHMDGQIVFANSAGAKILGLTAPEDLVGKRLLDFVHPDYQRIVKGRVKQLTENKKEEPLIEEKLIHLDGTVIDAEVTAIPFTYKNRRAVQVVFNDITERKQAEAERQAMLEIMQGLAVTENLQEFLQLVRRAIAKVIYAENFLVIFHNKSTSLFEEVFTVDQYDASMPPSKLERSITSYVFRTGEPLLLTQAKLKELVARGEVELVGTNPAIWLGAPLKTPRETIGVIAVQNYEDAECYSERDREFLASVGVQVSLAIERKQAEEALRQAEAKYHNIFENSIEGIFQSTPAGKFSTANPALARMLGYASPEELIADVTDLNRKFYVQTGRREEFMKQLSEHGTIVNFESEVYQRDGGTIWISENAQAMRDHFGQILYYEGTLKDITERKKAEEEIRRRVAELEVLYENGLSIGVLLEPRKIAQKMIEILMHKLHWHHATIRLYHPETKRLELLALNEPGLNPDETQAEIDRLNKVFASPTQGLSGWVITHGKTIRSGDVQADKRYFSAFPEIRSGLYVPLMIGDRAIGAIAVESRQANRFSEEDERLLKTLAAQSAIAFENARLYQEAVSAAKRKAALHQGSLEIVRAGQEIEALCLAIHHAVQQVMPAETFTVSLLTEDGREVEAPYLFDRGIRFPNTRLPVEAGITGRVIKSKKTLRIKNVQKSRGVKPIMVDGSEPTRAVLSVPLLAQEKIIGVISAQSRQPDVYTVEDQIFMETLASEVAIAFENARLFGEICRRLAELESLSQVSISLTSAIDLQPLIENILASARNAIPASEKGAILLTEPNNALRLHAMSGYTDSRLIGLVLPDQQGYVTRVARERNPIKIDDAHAEYEVPINGTIEEIDAVQSGIAAPLIVKGKMIGVISLDNASRKAAFTESDLHLLVTFASSAAVAIENARLFTETQQRLHRLSALHSIDTAIGASVDTHVTMSIVLENLMTGLKADAAAVLLFNPLTRMLEYAAGRGFRVHVIEGLRLRLGEGLAGQAALQRRAINIADLHQADEVEQAMEHPISGSALVPLKYLEEEKFVAYHAIPLIAKGQVQGVLEIFRRTPMQVDQEWISFSEMLAGQTAIAIDNGRLFENLQQSNLELTLAYDATIQGWSQALELRDEETEGHTRRVTDLTLSLIQAMGIEEVETEHARRGSLLHDIGKIAVPDSILLKPGPLDADEWSVMRQHPQYAYDLLFPIIYLRPAIHIPYCHHEKWDGSGYPRGLKGEEFPMVARIFTIVDVYDALTSNRPYRLAWTRENALEYIREQSGKHFDPRVVKAFMTLIADVK